MRNYHDLTLTCRYGSRNIVSVVGWTLAGAGLGALGGALFGTLFALPHSLLHWDASRIVGMQGYFACCGAVAAALTVGCGQLIEILDAPAVADNDWHEPLQSKAHARAVDRSLPRAIAQRMTGLPLGRSSAARCGEAPE